MINIIVDDQIIGQVSESTNLDYWDGNNYTCGSTGRHKGLTQLSNDQYVLIHTSQWEGERNSAEAITADQALREILLSGNEGLFKIFPELEELNEKSMLREKEAIT